MYSYAFLRKKPESPWQCSHLQPILRPYWHVAAFRFCETPYVIVLGVLSIVFLDFCGSLSRILKTILKSFFFFSNFSTTEVRIPDPLLSRAPCEGQMNQWTRTFFVNHFQANSFCQWMFTWRSLCPMLRMWGQSTEEKKLLPNGIYALMKRNRR